MSQAPYWQSVQSADDLAIAMAQASIDRCQPVADLPQTVVEGAEAAEIQQLATTLDLLGQLGVGSLAKDADGGDAPTMLGRFRVLNERGRGGFGVVLRAFDPDLQREVALKIPRLERLMAGQSPDDFIQEAQVAAHLEHPGIVRVYEAGRLGQVWYIASGYCAGPTLAEWFDQRESPLSPRIAAGILADVADAVHYAHSRGVLHLDLKPENILLESSEDNTDSPHPLVTDFGLAGRSNSDAARTMRIAGTFAYMAPEQRAGDSRRLGVATDVYALGAVLYELLNGRTNPRQEPSDDLKAYSFPSSPPALPPVQPNTPADLDAICRKCLRFNPDERYGSSQELAADLRRFLRGELVTARTALWSERLVRGVHRRPLVTALGGLLAVIALTSVIAITHLWRRAESNLVQLQSEQEVHAQTSDRMRSSLLNLTWLIQEERVQQDQFSALTDAELMMLREFYREVRVWSNSTTEKGALDAALRAASHSFALIDDSTALSQPRVDEEFSAGVAAWQAVIAQQPAETHWRRALALHVLTYAARSPQPNWLWWRNSQTGGATIDSAASAIIEEPYALLLVEFAGQRGRFRGTGWTYDMLQSAVSLLEERRDLANPGDVRIRTLLAAYNRMSDAARIITRMDRSREALAKAEALAAAAPPAAACPPLLALAVGDTHNIRSRVSAREGDQRGTLASLEKAKSYLERAVTEFPDEAAIRMSLANVLERAANLHASLAEKEPAITQYRAAIAVLDFGIARTIGHRNLTKRRAAVERELANFLVAAGDRQESQAILEAAVRDYNSILLSNQDSHTVWMQAIRCWQTLGGLYADQGRTGDAVVAYEKSLALLEGVKPRRGTSSQFKEYAALSRDALTRLLAQKPAVESLGQE